MLGMRSSEHIWQRSWSMRCISSSPLCLNSSAGRPKNNTFILYSKCLWSQHEKVWVSSRKKALTFQSDTPKDICTFAILYFYLRNKSGIEVQGASCPFRLLIFNPTIFGIEILRQKAFEHDIFYKNLSSIIFVSICRLMLFVELNGPLDLPYVYYNPKYLPTSLYIFSFASQPIVLMAFELLGLQLLITH